MNCQLGYDINHICSCHYTVGYIGYNVLRVVLMNNKQTGLVLSVMTVVEGYFIIKPILVNCNYVLATR